jgi:hypothetical protein
MGEVAFFSWWDIESSFGLEALPVDWRPWNSVKKKGKDLFSDDEN